MTNEARDKLKDLRPGREPKPGWELNTGLFEVHWKRGHKGLYADKVRISGTTFHYRGKP